MCLPLGLSVTSKNSVCRFRHSLYGLKQAPRTWFEKFRRIFQLADFKPSQYDASLASLISLWNHFTTPVCRRHYHFWFRS